MPCMPTSKNDAVVEEQRDALARGQLPARVLLGDLRLTAALPDLLAPRVQVLDERAQEGSPCGRLLGRAHQRPFQTGSRFSKNALTPSTMSSVDVASVSCARR